MLCSQIIYLAVQHLSLTVNLEVLCSMDIKKSTKSTGLDTLRTDYTSTESDQYATATIYNTIKENNNSSFYTYMPTDDHGNIDENKIHLGNMLNEHNKTTIPDVFNYHLKSIHTDVYNKTNDRNKTCDESMKILIRNELEELYILNNTIKIMLEEVINATWSYINNHDEDVGCNATNLGREYLQRKSNFLVRIKNINTFIDNFNCTPIHLPEEEYEDELRIHKNIILKFKYLRDLISDYYKIHEAKEESDNIIEKYNTFRYLTDLKKSIEIGESVKAMIYSILQSVQFINSFTQANNLEDIYETDFTTELLDLNVWKLQLDNKTKELEQLNRYLEDESFRVLMQEYIQPTVQGIIFVIGFVGNGVLVFIFARHKDTRTVPNIMLLNLAVGDLLNLIVNIPTFYSYSISTKWQFGLYLCKTYRFLRQLGIGVSVYSIVVISVQRFIVVTESITFRRYGCQIPNKLKVPLLISVVWIIGSMIAIPHTVYAGIYEGNCYGASAEHHYYPKAITLIDLLFFCLIPLAIIILLSVLSAHQLKKSVRKLPGETIGMEKVIKIRIVSSNVLIALAILSAVSYIPLHLLFFVYAWTDYSISQSTYYVVSLIAYTLIFGNSCFNPIALYMVSKKFRRYFNTYLFCRRERKASESQNQAPTGISAIMAEDTL